MNPKAKTMLYALALLAIVNLLIGQTKSAEPAGTPIVLPAARPGDNLRDNLQIDGPTTWELDRDVRLEILGIPSTLPELEAWAGRAWFAVQWPIDADQDDADVQLVLERILPAGEWKLFLEVRARVAGDYAVSFSAPGKSEPGPVRGATHPVRFGDPVPPKPDPVMVLSPDDDLISKGPAGGPFVPPEQVYLIANEGKGALEWHTETAQAWIVADPPGGSLPAGQSIECRVGFSEAAKALSAGTHVGRIDFVNVVNSKGNANRFVSLDIEGEPPPPPPSGLHVLIVCEMNQRHKLPHEQSMIFSSKLISDYLDEHCVKDGDDPQWHMLDPDSDVSDLADDWQRVFARTEGKELPWIIIANKDASFEGKLPDTVDDTLALLKKYGGE